jgi:hypothetical protein
MNVWEISEKFEGEERTKGDLSGTFVRWGKEIKPVWEGQGYEKKEVCSEKGREQRTFCRARTFCAKE